MSDTPAAPPEAVTPEAEARPSLRYVVAGVCRFEFVTAPTPEQERDIPLMIAKAVADVVDGYTTRNTQAATVEFVSVSEI